MLQFELPREALILKLIVDFNQSQFGSVIEKKKIEKKANNLVFAQSIEK